jgi:hypothetical protein
MTTFGTEMAVFRSQVRYPITPADPDGASDCKQSYKINHMSFFSTKVPSMSIVSDSRSVDHMKHGHLLIQVS